MTRSRPGGGACASLAEFRSAYVDGALGTSDREKVLRHLVDCADCRAEVAELHRIRELLGGPSVRRSADTPDPLTGRLVAIAGEDAHEPLWTRPFDRPPVRPGSRRGPMSRRAAMPSARRRNRFAGAAGAVALTGVVVGAGMVAAPPAVDPVRDPTSEARAEFGSLTAQLPLASEPVTAVMMAARQLSEQDSAAVPDVAAASGDLSLEPGAAVSVLHRAAEAADDVSYSGEQSFTARVGSRTVAATLRIQSWATRGSVVTVFDSAGSRLGSTYLPASSTSRMDDGAAQAAMLERNYRLTGWRGAQVAGRAATVVQADRPVASGPSTSRTAGSVAARWWVDDATGLVLWFETYDSFGAVAVSAGFTQLSATAPESLEHLPARLSVPLTTTALTLSATSALERAGWSCPDQLAGLALVRVRTDGAAEPAVVHLAYSDGLTSASVFEQQGLLVDPPPGSAWDDTLQAFVSPGTPSLATWQSGQTVFTVVTDGSADLLAEAVHALPHEKQAPRTTMDRVKAGWARILDSMTG